MRRLRQTEQHARVRKNQGSRNQPENTLERRGAFKRKQASFLHAIAE